MPEEKQLLCIVCPTGCRLAATRQADGAITVTGNGCKRGIAFAEAELTHPTRSLTTTVRTAFPAAPVLPVRTDGEIPKEKIPEAMREIAAALVTRPLACGDTVLETLAGCPCRLIATSDILQELTAKG